MDRDTDSAKLGPVEEFAGSNLKVNFMVHDFKALEIVFPAKHSTRSVQEWRKTDSASIPSMSTGLAVDWLEPGEAVGSATIDGVGSARMANGFSLEKDPSPPVALERTSFAIEVCSLLHALQVFVKFGRPDASCVSLQLET